MIMLLVYEPVFSRRQSVFAQTAIHHSACSPGCSSTGPGKSHPFPCTPNLLRAQLPIFRRTGHCTVQRFPHLICNSHFALCNLQSESPLFVLFVFFVVHPSLRFISCISWSLSSRAFPSS